jgi:nitrite reductase/ring-hydroxylating ferredoxin subunit
MIDAGGHTYGVFRIDGKLLAYLNECPHQGGPVGEGLLIHQTIELLDDQRRRLGDSFDPKQLNIVCAWHGWEFDVRTGLTAGDGRYRLRSAKVSETGGKIHITPLDNIRAPIAAT